MKHIIDTSYKGYEISVYKQYDKFYADIKQDDKVIDGYSDNESQKAILNLCKFRIDIMLREENSNDFRS